MKEFHYGDIKLYLVEQTYDERKSHTCGGCYFNNNSVSYFKLLCIDGMVFKTKKDLRKNKIEEFLR
jgi:hypothetical protein